MMMNPQQQEQPVSYKYLFIITPLEITSNSNSKAKSSSAKAVLIKLGNKTAKCSQMRVPLELEIDVLYSNTLHKYCPIKGIIKIYDISEDGSEVISCVGGFQTDELLNDSKTNVVIEKELGTSRLKMQIDIVDKSRRGEEKQQRENNSTKGSNASNQKPIIKDPLEKPTTFGKSIPTPKSSDVRKSILSSEGVKGIEIPFKNTSSNINKSLEKINQALNFKRFEENPMAAKTNELLSRAEVQTLRQQLTDQRKKSALNEDRLTKANSKVSSYQALLLTYQNQSKASYQLYKRLLQQLDLTPQNRLQAQLKQAHLALRYKDKRILQTLQQFIEHAYQRVRDYAPPDAQAESSDSSLQEVWQLRREVGSLRKAKAQGERRVFSLEKQVEGMEATLGNLRETNRHVGEENRYLREKMEEVEGALCRSEGSVERLRKELERCEYQNYELENRLYNLGLQNEELREEVANYSDSVQQYREKYGDLKNVKNRAIEMEIRECIRWLDLQNRDLELSDIEDTMQSSHKDQKDDSLSSVIRNIEIEKVPRQEMTAIREELLRILNKIDSLMLN